MSPPRREELEQRKRALLESAREERQNPARAAAGLDAVLRGEVAPIGVEPPPLGPPPGRAKWVALGVVVLLALLFVFWRVLSPEPEPVPPLPPTVIDAGPAPAPALPRIIEPVPEPTPATIDAGAAPQTIDAGVAPAPRRAVATSEEELPDGLEREVALLDKARGMLATDPAMAMKTLDKHRAEFPTGAMKLEADVVRVEALLKLGRRDVAERLAKQLTAADTEGLVGERLKRLLEQP